MSSITAADLKLGGRLVAAADAMGAGHLRRAAGIFNEIADDLNVEAENVDGILSEEPEEAVEWPLGKSPIETAKQSIEQATVISQQPLNAAPADMQMCARNVHSYSAPDPHTGWSKCAVCGTVSVVGHNQGPYDMSARQ